MDIKEAAKDLLNKESIENKEEDEIIQISQKICELKKATQALEIGNTTLEKKINDAKMERAKLLSDVNLYDKLIDMTKNQVKREIVTVNDEKNKLDEIQTEVWTDLQKFAESSRSHTTDEDFKKCSDNYEAELRAMEKEILKLASEVDAMQDITKMQEEKIAEIERMNRKNI